MVSLNNNEPLSREIERDESAFADESSMELMRQTAYYLM